MQTSQNATVRRIYKVESVSTMTTENEREILLYITLTHVSRIPTGKVKTMAMCRLMLMNPCDPERDE
jgi:hypothetical protein